MQTEMTPGQGWPMVKPLHGRFTVFALALLFLVVTGGMAAIITSQFLARWSRGHLNLALGGAAILVLLFCVVFLWLTVRHGLMLFLPGVQIRSPQFAGRAGERVTFKWSFTRPPTRMRELKIMLEGYEERCRGYGKNDAWKRTTFLTRNLLESTHASDFESGELQVVIPSDAKPTRMERTYRLRWMLTFKGQVPSFPDLHESYEVRVLPADGTAS